MILKDSQGKSVQGRILPVEPADVAQLTRWYQAEKPGQPVYARTAWEDWWVQQVREGTAPGTELKKLVVAGHLVGLVYYEKAIVDCFDGQPTTLLRGLRVAPDCNRDLSSKPRCRGVGTAMLAYLVLQSVQLGTSGVGVNSSQGKAEGFYARLFGPSRGRSFDGKRKYFSLKNESRLHFLSRKAGFTGR